MMRIVHVLHGHPTEAMGGTGLYVQALSRALASMGHTVAIASPDPEGQTRQLPSEGGVEIWRISTPTPRRWEDTWNGPTSAWQTWCQDWKPDTAHIHHLSGWPLDLIEATPCKTVLTLHDYAIPCARGQLLTDSLTLCSGPAADACSACLAPALKSHPLVNWGARMLAKAPALYTIARRQASRGAQRTHPSVANRIKAAERAMAAADCVLSPSQDLADRFIAWGLVSPGLTELPLVRPTLPVTAPEPGPVRFLYASSIIPSKGVDTLLECFAALNGSASLTIAGHAPCFDGHPGFADRLKRRAHSLDGVRWLGAIPSDEVPALMSRHDALVLPSIWPENSPLVVREATAQGLPIIGPALGGCGELAPNALRVATADELLAAMETVCQNGRTRLAAQRWPSPSEHAQTLLATAYA